MEMNLNLKPRVENEWRAPVLKAVALKEEGIAEVAAAIDQHREYLNAQGLLPARERARWRAELENILQKQLLARALNGKPIEAWVEKIAAREMDVYQAADAVMDENNAVL